MQKQDDLEYVLKNLKGDDLENKVLQRRFVIFKKKYEDLIVDIFSGNTDEKVE